MKKLYFLHCLLFLLIASPFVSQATVSENLIKSIVRIGCSTDEGSWTGSGVIISNDGYIITNKHVVSGESKIYSGCDVGITENSSSPANFLYKAETVIAAAGVDLALLKITNSNNNFNYVSVYPYLFPSMGTEIQALGYPPRMGGDTITYTKGYVSGVVGSQDDPGNYFIKADVKIDAGNSGGGAFIGNDELAGITSAVLAGKYNSLGLIIPTATIRDFLYVNSYNFLIHGEKTSKGQDEFYEYGKSSPAIPSSSPSSNSMPSDGSLIMPDRNLRTNDCPQCPPTVYLIEDGAKRPVGGDVFTYCGFKWEDVKTLDGTLVEAIPTGAMLSQFEAGLPKGVCYLPKNQRKIRQFSEGTLIQVQFKSWSGFIDNTIYIIENGKKRPFPSREVFESLGYSLDQLKSNRTYVTEEEFYQYPIGDIITLDNPPKNKQKKTEQPQPSQVQKESTISEQSSPAPSEQGKENKEEKGNDSNIKISEQRRSIVASAVQEIIKVAERNGGIGQEIKVIAQTQTQNQEKLEAGMQKIQSRSGFAKFFIGPNYGEIKNSQKVLEQNREQIKKLNEARTQIINQGDQLQIVEQIQALEQVSQQMETLLNESQKGFSLFGWVFRLFS